MGTSLAEFINQSAKIMANDRPDIWSHSTAALALSEWVNDITTNKFKADDTSVMTVGTGGWEITRVVDSDDDGHFKEWTLKRQVLSYFDDDTEPDTNEVFDWTTSSQYLKN